MEQLARIVGVGFLLAVVGLFLRQRAPEFTPLVSALFVFGVLIALLPLVVRPVELFSRLAQEAGLAGPYFEVVLRAIAIAYVTTIGAQVSRDAGDQAIAATIELAGKLTILALALPLVGALFQAILGLLP